MGSVGTNEVFGEWTDKEARSEYLKYDFDVNSDEWKNATMYVGGRYYTAIQRALWSGKMEQKTFRDGVKDMSPYIKALDESMRPLSSSIELSRTITYDNWENSVGVDMDSIQKITEGGNTNHKALDKAIGKIFSPKGYTSTSYNENQNANVGAQVLLKLQTPAGTKAIVTGNKMESEVILHRNIKYKITGYHIRTIAGTRKQIVFTGKVLR